MNGPEVIMIRHLCIDLGVINEPTNDVLVALDTSDVKCLLSIRIAYSFGDGVVFLEKKLSAPEIPNFDRCEEERGPFRHPVVNLSRKNRLDCLELFHPTRRQRFVLIEPAEVTVKFHVNSRGIFHVDPSNAPNRPFKLKIFKI